MKYENKTKNFFSIQNNLEEKKDNKKTHYLSTKILSLINQENDIKLHEMCLNLLKYKREIQNYIEKKENINFFNFKQTLFEELEKILIKISDSSNQIRKNIINKIYKWYKNKIKNYLDLNSINEFSYPKNKLDFIIYKKNNNYNKDNIQSHRNLFNIKQKFKEEYKNKKLNISSDNNKEIKIKFFNEIKNIENNEELNDKEKNIQIKDIKSHIPKDFGSNEINFFNKNNNKKILCKKNYYNNEYINSSFSFNKPKFNYQIGNIEKNIIEEKNKKIIEKRNQEETIKKLKDFDQQRAIYKSNVNNIYEIKDIIKIYNNSHKYCFCYRTKNKIIKNENNIIIDESNNKIENIEKNTLIIDKNENDKFIFSLNNCKIVINNIKNLDDNNLIKNNKNIEKIYTINLKLKKNYSLNLLLNSHKQENRFHNDSILHTISNDNIFKNRFKYNNLLSLNYFSNPIYYNKSTVTFKFYEIKSPLSYYDLNKNFNYIIKNKNKDYNNNYNKIKYIHNKIHNSFDNLKDFKNKINNFNLNEYFSLKKKFNKNNYYNNNNNQSFNSLNKYFKINSENEYYSKYFLPINNGKTLLNKLPEINYETKKRKKKKLF